jgi:3-isopropylmalate/(R)-2-methylmalate dehydratase small subunit
MTLEGLALKYDNADHVSTDQIWPGEYTYVQLQPEQMVDHAMKGFDPEFARKARRNSILVVGKNFGCGSSREQAAECIKYSGIEAVIAHSFARIFYRNAINIGLPVIESPEVVEAVRHSDNVVIDLRAGKVNVAGREFVFAPYPQFVLDLVEHGGLISMLKGRR